MKKKILIAFVYILGIVYLLVPTPPIPDLDTGVRSDEPGDTWQHPEQKAFYNNLDRQTVLNGLEKKFSNGLISFRLNYPPEEVTNLVRDQLRSYYLEEIVHPLRESLYVNGWEPDKSPSITDSLRRSLANEFKGVTYTSKVTLRPVIANRFGSVFVWTMTFPLSYGLLLSFRKTLEPICQKSRS